MNDKNPAIYILASQKNGTLYIGVTSNLLQRVWQHRNKLVNGFSKTHSISMLIYYELHDTMESAITREKQLKGGSRAKKLKLIENMNPQWNDLYETLF